MKGTVVSVNLSESKGTAKHPVPSICLTPEGVAGDAHAGAWHRQVSLLALEQIEKFSRECGREFHPGDFAENITTAGLDLARMAVRDRLRIGTTEIEITQLGKKCHGGDCAIFRSVGKCVMPTEGIFARVTREGEIHKDEQIEHFAHTLHIRIITLSDRASHGEYEDKSGPAIETALMEHFSGRSPRLEILRQILPDDAALLHASLETALKENADVIFTTGGTGIGPRDITPEVVRPLLDKEIPGVMESIRMRYGQSNPAALLSRSVAGVTKNGTVVYTLPGSVKAVEEYLTEIKKTLGHSLRMIRGIDQH